MPTKRALGINWVVENDKLGFIMNLGNQPYAKKGMLSTINKIYDPLGLASPFLLRGQKNLMQKKFTWDEQVSAETIEE